MVKLLFLSGGCSRGCSHDVAKVNNISETIATQNFTIISLFTFPERHREKFATFKHIPPVHACKCCNHLTLFPFEPFYKEYGMYPLQNGG
jgi:hypothetical protein